MSRTRSLLWMLSATLLILTTADSAIAGNAVTTAETFRTDDVAEAYAKAYPNMEEGVSDTWVRLHNKKILLAVHNVLLEYYDADGQHGYAKCKDWKYVSAGKSRPPCDTNHKIVKCRVHWRERRLLGWVKMVSDWEKAEANKYMFDVDVYFYTNHVDIIHTDRPLHDASSP